MLVEKDNFGLGKYKFQFGSAVLYSSWKSLESLGQRISVIWLAPGKCKPS
jgi:hypothetical protein